MGNFAISASDDVVARGRDLIERLSKFHGEKQSLPLERMFDITEKHVDGETMKRGGVDVQALDASLANIRTMFLSAVTGKEQIMAEKDGKIAEIKVLKDKMEKDLREKLDAANTAKEQAVKDAEAAAKAAAQAVKDAGVAKEQAETAASLAAEKDRTIATLADKLSTAESKADGYDALRQEATEAQEQVRELERTIAANQTEAARKIEALTAEFDRRTADAEREHAAALEAAARELKAEKEAAARVLADAGKDHETAIRELTAQMERRISEAEKDAALATEKAVTGKEREMTALLREAEKEYTKENARLQTRIETLEERIRSLEAQAGR